MKPLYFAAWVVVIGLLVWSGSLLIKINSLEAETTELHQLDLYLDSLAGAWLDLNRPGNDVLENYDVEGQRDLFEHYKRRYIDVMFTVQRQLHGSSVQNQFINNMQSVQDALLDYAGQVFNLAEERELLRQEKAHATLISEKETAAATAMAHMDQTFQNGLDMILQAKAVAIERERELEVLQSVSIQRLYIMLLVTLLVFAHSLVLIRLSMRQREALHDSAIRIQTIVNNIVDGIITVDSNGSIESINQSAEKMFGYEASEMLDKKFVWLLVESCRNTYLNQLHDDSDDHMKHAFLTGECEALAKRKDGSTFPIELTVNVVMVKGQQLFIHIVRDVTEQKQADQKLRLAASVFENASEGIVVTDVDGAIQSVNPAYLAITQYTETELIGNNPRLLQSRKQSQEFYKEMWASILNSGHWEGEIWNRRKNGEIFPQWLSINAIFDNLGRTTNYIGVAWDISELKESQQMKEEFITTISHELRTPLTSVLGSLGMLAGNMTEQLPVQAQKLFSLAHSNSRRLVRLIDDILDIEKIEAGRMTFKCEPLELETLVLRVVEESKVLAEQEDVRIACLVTTSGAWVNGDADRLMQALSNLLTNAIKYSPPGDSIEVVVGTHYSMHRIEVTDHGPGISEEFRSQIFKRFTQARGVRKGWKAGTGLGLSITKLIVQHHGGHIDYSSTPGVSTTFFLDLPRAEEQCSTAAASSLN